MRPRVCSRRHLPLPPSRLSGYLSLTTATPQEGEPPLKKAISAELGCVTPYIVVPGKWTSEALEYYADECVAGLANNAGHNCTKLEVLVTAQQWPQREAFVDAVRCDAGCGVFLRTIACFVNWVMPMGVAVKRVFLCVFFVFFYGCFCGVLRLTKNRHADVLQTGSEGFLRLQPFAA